MLNHLLEVSIRSFFLALAATSVLWLARRRRTAALQHAVWTAVVCGMLALLVFGAYLPRMPLQISSSATALPAISTIASTELFSSQSSQLTPRQEFTGPAAASASGTLDWNKVALAAYLTIALVFLIRFVLGIFLARKLIRQANRKGSFYESELISVPVTLGYFRPRIVLPVEWHTWENGKLNAVLTHESAHIRRRDALVKALAHLNRCIFWFHPLAWILESKLGLLAEQACDESSVAMLGDRESYANLILEMAAAGDGPRGRLRHHALTMAARSHIRQRIESLLSERRTFSRGLSRTGWAAVVLCGMPVLWGAGAIELERRTTTLSVESSGWPTPATLPAQQDRALIAQVAGQAQQKEPPAPPVHARSQATGKPLAFDVASIKPISGAAGSSRSEPGLRFLPGKVESLVAGVTAKQLVAEAYQLTEHQLLGAPGWIGSDRFTLEAKTDARANENEIRLMLQELLSDRFKLVASHGTRRMRIYALTVRRNGSGPVRYQVNAEAENPGPSGFQKADAAVEGHTGGRFAAFPGTTMELFARSLSKLRGAQPASSLLGRPVLDRTGLQGLFNLQLAWNDDDDFMTALQDELGLRLESEQAEVDVLTIERIEKPSAN